MAGMFQVYSTLFNVKFAEVNGAESWAPGVKLYEVHDGLDGNPTANRGVLVQALPLILDGLRAAHLTPVRLDQLLHTRAYTPC